MGDVVVPGLAELVGEVTTAALARDLLGGKKPRAANAWCRSHGVPLRRDGKLMWVRIADVRLALAAARGETAPEASATVARAADRIRGRR